ncbi:hypothetical protein [Croceicoccus sp. BE223]|uniref:hypothetical protein n=1 Tax=Croceicoccus sp. BE223 TaxID=2817716 RepID=UPI00285B68C2|nr:hypothetical protein [Croceicoccus sp. BE223]MDR7103148.1 hypothetical protein [Croceicoccus sp. BE223]
MTEAARNPGGTAASSRAAFCSLVTVISKRSRSYEKGAIASCIPIDRSAVS